jgi:hypothetical protein
MDFLGSAFHAVSANSHTFSAVDIGDQEIDIVFRYTTSSSSGSAQCGYALWGIDGASTIIKHGTAFFVSGGGTSRTLATPVDGHIGMVYNGRYPRIYWNNMESVDFFALQHAASSFYWGGAQEDPTDGTTKTINFRANININSIGLAMSFTRVAAAAPARTVLLGFGTQGSFRSHGSGGAAVTVNGVAATYMADVASAQGRVSFWHIYLPTTGSPPPVIPTAFPPFSVRLLEFTEREDE